MQQARVPYRKILFVCVNQRESGEACCSQRGSASIAEQLKQRIKALGLARFIRVSKSGCQDVCAKGPSVMVFPDYRWYYGVSEADVPQIIEDVTEALSEQKPPAS